MVQSIVTYLVKSFNVALEGKLNETQIDSALWYLWHQEFMELGDVKNIQLVLNGRVGLR